MSLDIYTMLKLLAKNAETQYEQNRIAESENQTGLYACSSSLSNHAATAIMKSAVACIPITFLYSIVFISLLYPGQKPIVSFFGNHHESFIMKRFNLRIFIDFLIRFEKQHPQLASSNLMSHYYETASSQ